jgi:hypothetical protein
MLGALPLPHLFQLCPLQPPLPTRPELGFRGFERRRGAIGAHVSARGSIAWLVVLPNEHIARQSSVSTRHGVCDRAGKWHATLSG